MLDQTLAYNRLGVCSWSFHPDSPEDLIAQLRQVELSFVQLALIPLWDDSDWMDAGAKLADAGIHIASGMVGTIGEDYSTLETIAKTGGIVPDKHWEKNYIIFEKAAALAEKMQIPSVLFHAGFIPHDKNSSTFTKLTERISKISDLFAKHNVQILLETGQETAQDLLALLNSLNRDNLYVNFDPANMILYAKGDPIQAVKLLLPKLGQIHIKDAKHAIKSGTWGKEVAIGEGDVNWEEFFKALKEGNYQGNYIIEREAGDQRIADIKKAISFIQSKIK